MAGGIVTVAKEGRGHLNAQPFPLGEPFGSVFVPPLVAGGQLVGGRTRVAV
jgi:hypothetical protein